MFGVTAVGWTKNPLVARCLGYVRLKIGVGLPPLVRIYRLCLLRDLEFERERGQCVWVGVHGVCVRVGVSVCADTMATHTHTPTHIYT